MELMSCSGAGFYEGTVRGGKPVRLAAPIPIPRSPAGSSLGGRAPVPVPGRGAICVVADAGPTGFGPELPVGTGPGPASAHSSLAASLSWEGEVAAAADYAVAYCGGAAVPPPAPLCAPPLDSVCSSPVHGLILVESANSSGNSSGANSSSGNSRYSNSDSNGGSCRSGDGCGCEAAASGRGPGLDACRQGEGRVALHPILAAEVAKALTSSELPLWEGRRRSVGGSRSQRSVWDATAPTPAEAAPGDVKLPLSLVEAPSHAEAGDGFRFPPAVQTTTGAPASWTRAVALLPC
ncbi:hypothetical protein HYH03_007059 [Edaphochlamys debaryana]|uniref:Uncharacterized protein n=1 Tax=Edaphochlamys debaryana TaxID=47281 RepID=A0A836C0D5_9CHLO|nr:hypothetical protein HYH03_007059 [Edaphochlamys debaryana]|eukprot:KAG2494817.1 hypothetical protein HYH03_007059 [Edaphochlamys debaryana]